MDGQAKSCEGEEVLLGTGVAMVLEGPTTLLQPSSTKPLDLLASLFL